MTHGLDSRQPSCLGSTPRTPVTAALNATSSSSATRDSPPKGTPDPYRPGGRWEAILRLAAAEPVSIGQILRATADGRYSRATTRRKIIRALDDMNRLGLLARDDQGHRATAHGVRALLETPAPEAP